MASASNSSSSTCFMLQWLERYASLQGRGHWEKDSRPRAGFFSEGGAVNTAVGAFKAA
ncbi:hypothetical protein Cni_G11039 [Canna indica]|uniref:Uncharacterized protein n=1 Tax=Canna indica TaxID=4628 RepID=A0AAQ3K5J9_9LILI|nr:hypothetical protein Cni_G11039 [Canna indica]